MRGRRVRLLRTQRWPRRGHSHRNHRGPHPAHRRVRVVLQVLLLQTEGTARATGGRDDATRARDDAEISVRTGVRPICVVGGFVSLLRLFVLM